MVSRAVLMPLTTSEQFREIAATFSKASESNYPQSVEAAIELFAESLRTGRKLLLFGNGGSAADAQHLSAELVVRFRANRRALPAIALCCDAAVMTACGNDLSYDDVFA